MIRNANQNRPSYGRQRVEAICSLALAEVGLLPAEPSPIRIDRFIEKKFGISHDYDETPDGVLGFSLFNKRGVTTIVIARALDEEGTVSSKRRIRTTLAHEAGHGLLHRHLFVSGKKPEALFNDGVEEPKILCREVSEAFSKRGSYDGGWWEVQANQAIGPLLMPRTLVYKLLEPLLVTQGTLGFKVLEAAKRETAARLIAETFDVNPAAARVRVDVLYPAALAGQLTL